MKKANSKFSFSDVETEYFFLDKPIKIDSLAVYMIQSKVIKRFFMEPVDQNIKLWH